MRRAATWVLALALLGALALGVESALTLHHARVGSPAAEYDRGTRLLLARRYDAARAPLEAVAGAAATTPALRQRAAYNAGNTSLEPAWAARAEKPDRAAAQRAVRYYRQALLLRPGDFDAKWNLELAERLLREAPEEPQSGGGGGEGGLGQPNPQPAAGGGGGAGPALTPSQAEQVLKQVAEAEGELAREKLQRTERPPPGVRDW